MNIKQLLSKLTDEVAKLFPGRQQSIERALNFWFVLQEAEMQLEQWVNDIYFDSSGELFVTFVDQGKLFRSSILVQEDNVSVQSPVEVKIDMSTTARSIFRTIAEGNNIRWVEIASTSVLNNSGEIDSKDLFDSFVKHIERTGEYPYRTFYHEGSDFKMGQYDFIARDDNVLIASGVYDNNSELAQMDIAIRRNNPGVWGQSIGFIPTSPPELWQVADGIEIPVYRTGKLVEISSVLADEAAALYTHRADIRQEVSRSMLEGKAKAAFVKLFDGDEEAADEWLTINVDRTNKDIERTGQIVRTEGSSTEDAEEVETVETAIEAIETKTEETSEDIVETSEAEEEEVIDEQVVEIDDDLVQMIVQSLMDSEVFKTLTATVQAFETSLQEALGEISQLQAANVSRSKTVDRRLEALEREDAAKQEVWVQDVPRRETTTRVSYRPSQDADQVDTELSLHAIAEATLAGLE